MWGSEWGWSNGVYLSVDALRLVLHLRKVCAFVQKQAGIEGRGGVEWEDPISSDYKGIVSTDSEIEA